MLERLKIEPGLDTPKVDFDPVTGHLHIEGKSFPPNVTEFYNPVVEWLQNYLQHPAAETILHLKLEYFNTASSKIIMDILYKLEEFYKQGGKVKVIWYYPEDDEDMQETGIEYSELLEIPFEIVSYKFVIEE
jgi:hypothetical protein